MTSDEPTNVPLHNEMYSFVQRGLEYLDGSDGERSEFPKLSWLFDKCKVKNRLGFLWTSRVF